MQFEDSPEILARFTAELELVDMVVRQIRREVGPVLETEEMLSFGHEGLLDAARRYDPERGITFRAYANYRVRGNILDGMRMWTGLPRRAYEKVKALQAAAEYTEASLEDTGTQLRIDSRAELADERLDEQLRAIVTAMTLGFGGIKGAGDDGEAIAVDEALQPDAKAEREELNEIIRTEVARLPDQERRIVERHFFDDVRIDTASKELGLSKSWGSRLLARALLRLSKRICSDDT